MKKIISILLMIIATSLFAEELALTNQQFFKLAREVNKSQENSSYAILDGYVDHIRNNNNELQEYPISMGIVINKTKTITQIIVDKREGYMISKNENNTSIIPLHKVSSTIKNDSILENMGVNPTDLAMGFMNYNLVDTLFPTEKVKMVNCRILLLEDTDSKEVAKVYITEAHLFPLKVEFYNNMQDYQATKINRTLEVSSFKKENDLYYVNKFNIYGSGWRTIIEFEKAKVGLYDINNNMKIFRTLGE